MALSLRAAATHIRRDGNPYQPDADLSAYWRDLLAPFGMRADEEMLRASPNIGFVDLAEALLREVTVPVVDPDLLLLAYALPDLHPLKSVTAHLNYLLGGRSRCFAVSEQGLRAPFTALRVADAYAKAGRCHSTALFVCEQTTFAYHDPLVHDTPLVDSAVLLYFTSDGTFEYLNTEAAVPAEALPALVATVVGRHDAPALVAAGPWVTAEPLTSPRWTLHRGQSGTYCTSVWLELARHHDEWAERYRTVVLCDTDPRTGLGHVAVLRRPMEGQL